MASQPSAAQKSSSRWGSFLANVESRLDTILAEEDTPGKLASKGDGKAQELPGKKDAMVVPAPGSGSQSRTPSANRAQDRLNERLARAMANKNLGKKTGDGSPATSEVPSRAVSPANGMASPRDSIEVQRGETTREAAEQDQTLPSITAPTAVNSIEVDIESQDGPVSEAKDVPEIRSPITAVQTPTIAIDQPEEEQGVSRISTDSRGSVSTRPSVDITRSTTSNGTESPMVNGSDALAMSKSAEEQEKIITQLRSDNEAAELRRQEETHEYLERIDALQAKLQYLTKEATEMAKNAMSEAKPGSLEQKLAKKDEQIALLIEEGQKLSQTELKHMSLIKKLRAKSGEDDKSVIENKKAVERHQKMARDAQDRAKRAETAERLASERAKTLPKLEKELETIKAERDADDDLVRDLQIQLSEVTSVAKEVEEKANAEALAQERQRASDSADELSNLKVEKELVEKTLTNEVRELKEKSEREKERARVAEIERKAEQDTLESRLETYRARAEEASAGQGGDVQAKLLRQIETLQNQYAVASENWQGIEGSLLTRVTALEKERDEIAKREADIRRKAREANTKARRMEEEIERINAKTHEQDHELSSRSIQLSTLHEKFSKSEADVQAARNDLKAERESWEAQQNTRLEEERIRIKEELLRSHPDTLYQQFQRTESPANLTRKSSDADKRGSPALSRRRMQGLAITNTGIPTLDRPLSRRSSDKRITNSSSISDFTPMHPSPRTDSMSTVPQLSVNNGIPETPSIDDSKQDDDGFFDDITTPATPDRGTINDLISVSTAGAGPSVQLVERMSAAVRRLESEKAAHKDELARLGSQRDEAREQVVEMMKDGEGKKAMEGRVKGLEKELGEVKERYLTTLEMLGEKSERVEELRADVVDLKDMYKELVERTTR